MPQRTYINVIQETAFSLVQLPYFFAMFQPNPPGKRNNFLEHHFCVRKKAERGYNQTKFTIHFYDFEYNLHGTRHQNYT